MSTVDRIKFTKEFNYHGMSEWIGVEASLDPGENVEEAILKAREQVVATFNKTIPPIQVDKIKNIAPDGTDVEFEALKVKLSKIEFREDAQAYLETTDFRMAIQAKNLVNKKPLKNK